MLKDTKYIELLKWAEMIENKEKKFENYTKKQKELIKEIIIERLKTLPDNLKLSIG